MALTFDGLNYISKASALVASPPFTLACWVNFTTNSADAYIMGITSATAAHSSFFAIQMLTASKKIIAAIGNDAASTTDVTAATSTTTSTATWYHVAAVFTSASSRTAYLNGAGATTSVVSVTPGTCDTTTAGTIKFNNIVKPGLIGQIAFPCVIGAALSAADVLSLVGIGPHHRHPSTLKGYARLTGGNSPEPDMMSSTGWTLVLG